METIIASARQLVASADEAGRKKILDGLRDLSYSIETPQDSIQRILFEHMRLAAARIACDLELFNMLSESEDPLSTTEIAQKASAAPTLTGRLLRYMASIGLISETDQDMFTSNSITKAMTNVGYQGGVHHYFDSLGPAIQALPDFLQENNYQDITDMAKTPLQKAWHTDMPAFIWVQTKPENFAHFNQWMTVQRDGMPTWLDVYPHAQLAQALEPDQIFFVDIGGGLGHQAIALRNTYPDVSNEIILQDIPATLEHAIQHRKVRVMVQDFWQPQEIKGAKIYYMRNILHDYPDDKAVTILQNTKAVLGPSSVILIDEMVIPNSGAHWQATQLDLAMMTALGSRERTREQWYALIDRVGDLKINRILTYTNSLQDSIIEVVAT